MLVLTKTIKERILKSMLFNSYEFIFVFLPITLIGFNILTKKNKRKRADLFFCA